MLQALQEAARTLKPTATVERTLFPKPDEPPKATRWVRSANGWTEVAACAEDAASAQPSSLQCGPHEAHGQCFGFEAERNAWVMPTSTFSSEHAARPGYDTLDASEYLEAADVLEAKVKRLAQLVQRAQCCVIYAGAGLSTSAGISDYATHNHKEAPEEPLRSPMCAQPTLSHRVLVGLYAAGRLERIVQQNHDGLPQKAGMPQQAVNEIHGALYAPDNPVIPMSGYLREDLLSDLLGLEQRADLVIAIGTSLAGMNADRIVHACADRAARGQGLGSVLIGLQRTQSDGESTLRIFAPCDVVFERLAASLDGVGHLVPPPRAKAEYFWPAVLQRPIAAAAMDVSDGAGIASNGRQSNADEPEASDERYLLCGLRYDAMGRRNDDDNITPSQGAIGSTTDLSQQPATRLDLRDGAALLIPTDRKSVV